jgi:MGT family glycosyltransferase
MPKYVFVSNPMRGHVNPTFPVVRELVKRGAEVVYYLTEAFRMDVEAAGAVLRPYDALPDNPAPSKTGSGGPGNDFHFGTGPLIMARECQHIIPQVLERIRAERADYLVYDKMCMWGYWIAQALHIPAIQCNTTYASNKHFNVMQAQGVAAPRPSPLMIGKIIGIFIKLQATYRLPRFDVSRFFLNAEPLNIVFLPREFQPQGQTFDERFVFVGPALAPEAEEMAEPSQDPPLLYISLGTMFNNRADLFQLCFEAFGNESWQVVLSSGNRVHQTILGQAPANFSLAPFVPQLEILRKASVFLTHGGMNSTMESLYYGVPLVVIPQMFEQSMTAQQVEEMGLGTRLDTRDLSPAELRAAVERVASDPAIRERVRAMQQKVRSAGGAVRAAEAMLALERVGTAR